MEKLSKKVREYPRKPEWQIILDHLVYQDHLMVYRICRKMIIYLNRMNIREINHLLEELNPTFDTNRTSQDHDSNWPKPKGSMFDPSEVIDRLFAIADQYLSDEKITEKLNDWIHQENIGTLTMVLERRNAPFDKVKEAIKKYLMISYSRGLQSIEERVGLRVSLTQRFLSENLSYVNIAKDYLKVSVMDKVLDRAVGPMGGSGKLGGKSAGLILARQILETKKEENLFISNIKTPKSRFLTSDGLYEFLHYNALEEFVYTKYQDSDEIKKEHTFLEYIFKNSHFPPECISTFNLILDQMEGNPLIVRSSSILEDSFEGAFSGKYKSLFLSNRGTKEERLCALTNAIAEVYASTFGPDPIEYRRERGLLDYREEMGVLIQEVVGTKIGKYYMPSFAGVAFSNNEMRWTNRIKLEDGIIRMVAGLGTRAVDRTIDDYPTLICPAQPGLRVNLTIEDKVRYSQKYIDVINLETNQFETISFKDLIIECNGYFPGLEQIVSFNRVDSLIDPVSAYVNFKSEDLVVSFNNLIERTNLIDQLHSILNELTKAYGGPVDVEFASDGKDLYLLQCRPQSQFSEVSKIHIPFGLEDSQKLFTADNFVNNGLVSDVRYIVYVDSDEYAHLGSIEEMNEVGRTISKLNRKLPRRSFVLIGPGRWGSRGDIKLGVPVIYSDINNSSMLIEVAKEKTGYVPELSFGTHFFQDLVEANIHYLPLYPGKDGIIYRDDFFLQTENALPQLLGDIDEGSNIVRLIDLHNLPEPSKLCVHMDGEANFAVGFLKNDSMS